VPDSYSILKLIHVLSAALLIGVGAGSTFFVWYMHRSRDIGAISIATRAALLVEWWIVIPTVVVQPLTGLWMLEIHGRPVQQPWVTTALVLFGIAGVVWAATLVFKLRLRKLSHAAIEHGRPLAPNYHRVLSWWLALWWTLFALTLAILALMVWRPSL
jgi:uncharacterized membrane protein